eukprot:CAMPEP_0115534342 /NCGR_PEP_ID=MMETSP0271-20121206/86622_1 /TAXON_ID=71861 /ORGANISM="Scrippsiella trochoidea, Strain CCMP3099" /LENGTH=137 /DNA_ID=CAMNT_0002966821 /DNA_START=45 /DNA_END=458 /DNA_ORIENTATION=+
MTEHEGSLYAMKENEHVHLRALLVKGGPTDRAMFHSEGSSSAMKEHEYGHLCASRFEEEPSDTVTAAGATPSSRIHTCLPAWTRIAAARWRPNKVMQLAPATHGTSNEDIDQLVDSLKARLVSMKRCLMARAVYTIK